MTTSPSLRFGYNFNPAAEKALMSPVVRLGYFDTGG